MHQYNSLQLVMFSGKGGVGKTTLSCAFARHWARLFPNEQILLLSTDPAHSLGDVLLLEVEDTAKALTDLPNLSVRALDAQKLLQEFKARYGRFLELLVERGSFVQGEDLTPVWDLTWPGLDELMGLLEIQRLLTEKVVDRIVVDMAPSGHTLNLFGLTQFLEVILSSLELFQKKHRVISQSFTGNYIYDEVDIFLVDMESKLAEGRGLLQDKNFTACNVVAIPEPMSLLETERFIKNLQALEIPCGGILINHVLTQPDQDPDRYSEQQQLLQKFLQLSKLTAHPDLSSNNLQPLTLVSARREQSAHHLQTSEVSETVTLTSPPVNSYSSSKTSYNTLANPDFPVFVVPQQDFEPLGGIALDHLINQVQRLETVDLVPTPSIIWPAKVSPSFSDFIAEGRQILIVGGKGGVGKTTVAAAIGWALASRYPDKKIRLVSIDPAHSLGDAFGQKFGHEPMQITQNLSGQEVNAEIILEQFRNDYLWELAEMISGDCSNEGGVEIAYSPEAWRQIVAQALPGIDEMLSLLTVIDLLERKQQDLIILDTAPTGHLLRFLEMPTAMGDWLAWIFKLWMKYQALIGKVDLMGRLRTLRVSVVTAQKKLKDPCHTEFIGVFQAQAAIVAEQVRLTQYLKTMGVQERYVVHNRYNREEEIEQSLMPEQTIIRLPSLPRSVEPLTRIAGAANLLF